MPPSWRAALVLATGFSRGGTQRLDPRMAGDEGEAFTMHVDGRSQRMGVALDANYRWLYNVAGSTCDSRNPAEQESCFLQGVDHFSYQQTYGVYVGTGTKSEILLRYASLGKYASEPNYGSRVFVTDPAAGRYGMFNLLGKEIAFTIDISNVPAGMNAAVYLVSMDATGNLGARYADGKENGAGWKRGLGYCDAQCPRDMKFVQGVGWQSNRSVMSCCPEMDLFEGNRMSVAITAHPCSTVSASTCDTSAPGAKCENPCDTDGADANLFRRYGPDKAFFELADPKKPVRVRTRFRLNDEGNLSEIVQIYEQDMFGQPEEIFRTSITDDSVAEQKRLFREVNHFAALGGLAQMGHALQRGMVLVLAIWADESSNMNWLDSCLSGSPDYSCEDNSKFSTADTFWDAWSTSPGVWRGPADRHPDLSSSFASQSVRFSYHRIPQWMATQQPFHCPMGAFRGDCNSVPYQFWLRDLSVHTLNEEVRKNTFWKKFFIWFGVIFAFVSCAVACWFTNFSSEKSALLRDFTVEEYDDDSTE